MGKNGILKNKAGEQIFPATTADQVAWDKTTNLKQAMAKQDARISNLAKLPSGSTAGDAELQDIRTGEDGTVYDNAGEAVRQQIGSLKESIVHYKNTENSIVNGMDFYNINALPEISIAENKTCNGYNTSLFKPNAFFDCAGQSIYTFSIQKLRENGVQTITIPNVSRDDIVGQKHIFYTEGTRANNSIEGIYSDDNKEVTYKINTMTDFTHVMFTVENGKFYVKYSKSYSGENNGGVSEWVHTKDLDDKCVTTEKLADNIFTYYPFSKKNNLENLYRNFEPYCFVMFKICNAEIGYEYFVSNTFRNHVINKQRNFEIYRKKIGEEKEERIYTYVKTNEDGDPPIGLEKISGYGVNGEIINASIDWTKIGNVYSVKGYIDEALIDYNDVKTSQMLCDNNNQKSFTFTGNLISESIGEKKYSSRYDTLSMLPVWVDSKWHRTYTIECPRFGQLIIPLRSESDTSAIQYYLLKADNTVLFNINNARGEYTSSEYTKKGEYLILNCKKIYENGARKFTCTFNLWNDNLVIPSIQAVGCYVPSWLGVDEIASKIDTNVIESVIPSKLRVCVGKEMNIYYPNIFRYFNTDKAHRIYPTSNNLGNYEYFAKYTPKSSDKAFDTKFYLYTKNTMNYDFETTTMHIEPVPKDAGKGLTKKVLFIGDSLTDAGVYSKEIKSMFAEDDMSIELLGTLDTSTGSNEGRSGWRAYTYCRCADQKDDWATWGGDTTTSKKNPFYNSTTGKFDFAKYIKDQKYDGVDYVFINLGTNDIARGNHQEEADLKEYWDEIITSIHGYDPSIRVVLWLPPTRALYQNNRVYIDQSLKMNKWIISEYDNREDEKIYLCPVYMNIDPYHDYKSEKRPISARNTAYTIEVSIDSVHPADVGYYKIADVIYCMIKYLASLDS